MALQEWLWLAGVLVFVRFVYLALYRLVLGLRISIPGPKLAGSTSWYEVYYDILLPGQYVRKIREMHRQYGPTIRVAPNEVHVQDSEYLDDIYPGASKDREKYEFQLPTLPVPMSVGASRTHYLHRKRREALNPFFSKRSVTELESMIKDRANS